MHKKHLTKLMPIHEIKSYQARNKNVPPYPDKSNRMHTHTALGPSGGEDALLEGKLGREKGQRPAEKHALARHGQRATPCEPDDDSTYSHGGQFRLHPESCGTECPDPCYTGSSSGAQTQFRKADVQPRKEISI